ncbi:disulfide bond formation protein B [Pseudomaricurvus alkylphenolicus]|uniref:disulfide bond formation protein B n=1 Tax=Pseudomaricurvus alkylphenolicus TaxID=1306991 RepID=UPI00197D5A25|nr:disulfide bond formation protein B [Pseudomaricurvus alkylphenolicus]
MEFLKKHQRILGIVTVFIGIGAWALELSGLVYVCPYCRVQRTVIALLGLFLLFPVARQWVFKYLASVVGLMGIIVAVNQNFMHWKKISSGEFAFHEDIFVDPFILSGAALFIIVAQLWLILVDGVERKYTKSLETS